MLARLFRRPLRVRLGERVLAFDSPADFAFALAGRTAVPTEKVLALLGRPAEALLKEAIAFKEFKGLLEEAVQRSAGKRPAGSALLGLAPQLFAHDHRWQTIMATLRQAPPGCDAYRETALAHYLQYLDAYQELLETIYRQKTGAKRQCPLEPRSPARPGHPLQETLAFDRAAGAQVSRLLSAYERLPRGEAVTLQLKTGEELEMLLSKHRFRLIGGQPLRLVDEEAHEYLLREGQNLIGRGKESDVVIDNAYRDVSRKHLLIKPVGGSKVRLVDLSLHGTFVPARHLAVIH